MNEVDQVGGGFRQQAMFSGRTVGPAFDRVVANIKLTHLLWWELDDIYGI